MAVVSLNSYAGYLGKTPNETKFSAVATGVVPGDNGAVVPYSWINSGIGYNATSASSSNVPSGLHLTFHFDPAFVHNINGYPIDLIDNTSTTQTAYPVSNTGLWYSGCYGTTGANINWITTSGTTAGGYLGPTSAGTGTSYAVEFEKPNSSFTPNYETYYSSKKTIAMWYYCDVATPTGFVYAFGDNGLTTARYSGVTLQRPSNRTNAFTMLVGDNTGAASSDRRSHLGVDNSLSNGKWNFVVAGVDGANPTSQSTTTNYVCITPAGASSRTTSNNGISGTSGTATSVVINSDSAAKMRLFWYGGASVGTTDRIGSIYIFNQYLASTSSVLDDLWAATKSYYP